MNILQSIRDTLYPGPRPLHPFSLKKLDYEWAVGYQWYMSRLEGNIILDGGCLAHFEYDKILAHLGYTVIGVDIGTPPRDFNNFYFEHRSVWELVLIPLLTKIEVDTVLCNSLFEHLGLPCYGQPVKADADFATSAEFHRILKPGGCLLIQVPYGKTSRIIEHKGEPFYRIYDAARLKELLDLFTIEDIEYFIRDHHLYKDLSWIKVIDPFWLKVSQNVADKIDYKEGLPPCLVYVKARKV